MSPSFERSEQTDKIIALFATLSIGATMSFAAASKRLGFQMHSTLGAYQSAKRIAAKDKSIVIESVRGVGFVRLDASQIVARGGYHLRSLRRRAKRAAGEMEIAVKGNLDRDDMMRATEQLGRFRIIESTSQPTRAATNRVERAIEPPIEAAPAAAMFSSSAKKL